MSNRVIWKYPLAPLTEVRVRRGRKAMIGYERISKRTFYANGGFANSRCVRVTRNGSWAYYWRHD